MSAKHLTASGHPCDTSQTYHALPINKKSTLDICIVRVEIVLPASIDIIVSMSVFVYRGTYQGKACAIKLIFTLDLTLDVIQRVAAEASILSAAQVMD